MIGEKIKELRIRRNMTQEQLAGDTITRNMISLIEHGRTQPSVSTIEELAARLDAPPSYFFSEVGDLDAFRKLEAIGKIKKLYAEGEYGKCLSALVALNVSDDETELIWSIASLACGIRKYREGYLKRAFSYFNDAILHAEKTIYAGKDIRDIAERYGAAISYICEKEDRIAAPAGEVRGKNIDVIADIAYVGVIAGVRDAFIYEEECPLYAEHLTIRKGIDAVGDEQTLMQKLRMLLQKSNDGMHAVLQYYILCDLEILAQRVSDYKCAYQCSFDRRTLTEKMNK